MTTRTAVGPLRRSLAGARAVGAAPTYTTTGDTTGDDPEEYAKKARMACNKVAGALEKPILDSKRPKN